MKIIMAVGGTGGHLYPAQACAKMMLQEDPSIDLLFMGGGLARNHYFDRTRFSFQEVLSRTLSLKDPLRSIPKAITLGKGVLQSIRYLKQLKPVLVVGFGSYHSFPVLLAARFLKIPIILYEANAVPGRVNRFFSSKARVTGIFFEKAAKHLKGKTMLVEMPLREELSLSSGSQEEARRFFNLNPYEPVVLIFGGSQGAAPINFTVCKALIRLKQQGLPIQALHFAGAKSRIEDLELLYKRGEVRASVKEFEPQMALAWQACDLVVSRAGASSIAEQLKMEVPGILIPYPHASDNHQEENADVMVEEAKGALKLLEKELRVEQVADTIEELLKDDRKQLAHMVACIKKYKTKTKQVNLSSMVLKIAGELL